MRNSRGVAQQLLHRRLELLDGRLLARDGRPLQLVGRLQFLDGRPQLLDHVLLVPSSVAPRSSVSQWSVLSTRTSTVSTVSLTEY